MRERKKHMSNELNGSILVVRIQKENKSMSGASGQLCWFLLHVPRTSLFNAVFLIINLKTIIRSTERNFAYFWLQSHHAVCYLTKPKRDPFR